MSHLLIILFFIWLSGAVGWLLFNGTLHVLKKIKDINYKTQKLNFEKRALFQKYKEEVKISLESLNNEKTQGFPWLATAIADYYENYDKIFAAYLKTKDRPAYVQAEKIKKIAEEKKLFKKEFNISKYIIEYYEALFPWLREYVGFNSDELIKSIYTESQADEDPVSFYISKSEFTNLSVTERNQKALERYWAGNKNPWQIGRDYERYIGYLYEMKGFKVEYHGIEKVKEDLGRDLVCTKGEHIEIVQCKYWSSQKGIPIRENHVTQLYGTTVKYFLDHKKKKQEIEFESFPGLLNSSKITPVMVTTTALSKTAQDFASVLKIKVDQISMDNNYPCIKCNVS